MGRRELSESRRGADLTDDADFGGVLITGGIGLGNPEETPQQKHPTKYATRGSGVGGVSRVSSFFFKYFYG